MMSPRLYADQHSLAEVRPPQRACLAQAQAWGRFCVAGGASFALRAVGHEDHTPSPNGQPLRNRAALPDFSAGWFSRHRATARKIDRELVKRQGVGRTVDSSEGTGTCQFVTSFSRLARQPVLPHVATPSANRVWAAQPSAQARQPSQVGRWRRAQPSAPQLTSVIASLTPANVTDLAPLTALPAIGAGRAVSPSIFISTGTRAALADAAFCVACYRQRNC